MDVTFESVYDTWIYRFSYEFKLINSEKLIYQFLFAETSATSSINKYILLSAESKNKFLEIYNELLKKYQDDTFADVEEVLFKDEIFDNGILLVSVPSGFAKKFLLMLKNFIVNCETRPDSACCKKEFFTIIDPN